jgi:hypothetical protein
LPKWPVRPVHYQTERDQRKIDVLSLKSDEKSNTKVIDYLKTIGVYDLICMKIENQKVKIKILNIKNEKKKKKKKKINLIKKIIKN